MSSGSGSGVDIESPPTKRWSSRPSAESVLTPFKVPQHLTRFRGNRCVATSRTESNLIIAYDAAHSYAARWLGHTLDVRGWGDGVRLGPDELGTSFVLHDLAAEVLRQSAVAHPATLHHADRAQIFGERDGHDSVETYRGKAVFEDGFRDL